MEKTIGEQRVRVDFNVSGSTEVDIIKLETASLINLCENMKPPKAGLQENFQRDMEKSRLIALAQTAYEQAAMWAVKAATI